MSGYTDSMAEDQRKDTRFADSSYSRYTYGEVYEALDLANSLKAIFHKSILAKNL